MPPPPITIIPSGPRPDSSQNTSPHLHRFRNVPYPVQYGCCFPKRLLLPPLERLQKAILPETDDGNKWKALINRLETHAINCYNEKELVSSVINACVEVEEKGWWRTMIEEQLMAPSRGGQNIVGPDYDRERIPVYDLRPGWLAKEEFRWSSDISLRQVAGTATWDGTQDIQALREKVNRDNREKAEAKIRKEAEKAKKEAEKAEREAEKEEKKGAGDSLGRVQGEDGLTKSSRLNEVQILDQEVGYAAPTSEDCVRYIPQTYPTPSVVTPMASDIPTAQSDPELPSLGLSESFPTPATLTDNGWDRILHPLPVDSEDTKAGIKGKRKPATETPTDGGSSKRSKASDSSQKEGAHMPDIVFLSGVLQTIMWLIMEFKFVHLDRRDGNYAQAFMIAMREAIYQGGWYLHMGYKFNGVRHGMAWVDDRFVRMIICQDETLGIERFDGESSSDQGAERTAEVFSGQANQRLGQHSEVEVDEGASTMETAGGVGEGEEALAQTEARPSEGCIAITELEEMDSMWNFDTLGHRLMHIAPAKPDDESTTGRDLTVNHDAHNILLACILAAFWYAAAHHEPKTLDDFEKSDQVPRVDPVGQSSSSLPNDRLSVNLSVIAQDSSAAVTPFSAPNQRTPHSLFESEMYEPRATNRIDRTKDMTAMHGLKEKYHGQMGTLKQTIKDSKAKHGKASTRPESDRGDKDRGDEDDSGKGGNAGPSSGRGGNMGGFPPPGASDSTQKDDNTGGRDRTNQQDTAGKGADGGGSVLKHRADSLDVYLREQDETVSSVQSVPHEETSISHLDSQISDFEVASFDSESFIEDFDDSVSDEGGEITWIGYRARLLYAGVKVRLFTPDEMDREWHNPAMFVRNNAEALKSASSGVSVPATVVLTPPKAKVKPSYSDTSKMGADVQSRSAVPSPGDLEQPAAKGFRQDTLAMSREEGESMAF